MFSASLFFLQQPFVTSPRVVRFDNYDFLLFGLGISVFISLLLITNGLTFKSIAGSIKTESGFEDSVIKSNSGFLPILSRLLIYMLYCIGCILFVKRFDTIFFLDGFHLNDAIVLFVGLPFFVFLPIALCLYLSNLQNIMGPLKTYLWGKLHFVGLLLLIFTTLSYFLIEQQLFLFQSLITSLLIVFIFMHFRVIQFFIHTGLYWYYIILYFCTLEILPIVFLWIKLSR